MSDPLAHVGPSDCYLRGYNDGVAARPYLTPYPVGSVETAEYDEGYVDGHADVAHGLVLGQSKAVDLIPW